MSAEPIATHVEKNLERTGTYQLYPDRLSVSVSYPLRGTAESSLPLTSLASTSSLVRVHSSIFNFSLWLLLVAVVALAGISFVPSLSQSLNVRALLYSLIVFGVAGALLTARRLTFVTIHGAPGEAGVTVGVGPSGQAGLEAFVAQVSAARAARTPPAA
jgi:hypothetical protein